MARVLIAGAGYVGLALAKKLVDKKHEVHVLRRSKMEALGGVHAIQADLTSPQSLDSISKEFDYVFYTASAGEYSEQAYKRIYVDGPKNLIEVLKKCSLKRFFYISSTGVYADKQGGEVDDETLPDATSATGKQLIAGEQLVASASVQGCVVRFSGIYGPGRTRLLDEVYSGALNVSETDKRYTNRIHLDDCVAVLAFLMERDELDASYIASDDYPSLRSEVLLWLANELGVEIQEGVSKQINRYGSKRCLNKRLKTLGYAFVHPGYKEGYADILKEYKKERGI